MEALALLELDSIAAGIRAADSLTKRARVELIASHPIDPGKYMILFRGDVESVRSSFERGVEAAGGRLVDRVFLPAPDGSIVPILEGASIERTVDSIGVIETCTVAATIRAADAAAKATAVTLLRIDLARRIGGRGFVILTGTLADVEASVRAGGDAAGRDTDLFDEVVIAAPSAEITAEIVKEYLPS